MTTLQTVLGFDTSDRDKVRFHVLEVFYQGGWRAVHLAFPKLSRATLYRWKIEYEKSGKRLNSLVPQSTKPHHTRQMQTPPQVVELIKSLRQHYPRMGKVKVKRFTDIFCEKEGLPPLQESTIGKVIKRHHLFYAGKGKVRRVRKSQPKVRIKLCPQAMNTKAGYIQVDGVKFYYVERYYYFLTAVDIVSKQAWVKMVPTINSKQSAQFLEMIQKEAYYPVHTIQTDNGSEIHAFFEEAITEYALTHVFSYPRHPKTNGFVERFNWTIQDEFLFEAEDYLLYPDEFEEKLKGWLIWYNEQRPHQSLEYLSPLQRYKKGDSCLKSM